MDAEGLNRKFAWVKIVLRMRLVESIFKKYGWVLRASVLGLSLSLNAQGHIPTLNEKRIIEEFLEYLSIPNESDNYLGIEKNLSFVKDHLERSGVATEIIEFEKVKYLYGVLNDGAPYTLLIYLQLDALKANPSEWSQPDPFKPIIKATSASQGEYVFARGASDSKGPTFSLLAALQSLSEHKITPAVTLKIIGDTAEEKGSKTLSAFVASNRAKFESDGLLILDGTRSLADVPTLTYGARGIATFTLTTYAGLTDLHSGQYGSIIPNPWVEMTQVVASMIDENQKILIADFDPYQDSPEELNYFKELKYGIYDELEERLGKPLLRTYVHPQQTFHHPSLILREYYANDGSTSGLTRIPASVDAVFEMRLTPETPAVRQFEIIENHLKLKGYNLITAEPSENDRATTSKLVRMQTNIGSVAFRTPLNSMLGAWLEKGIKKGLQQDEILKLTTTGGSQPIASFVNTLNIDAIAMRIPNPDANIHGPNENIALKNLFEGIQSLLGILTTEFHHGR